MNQKHKLGPFRLLLLAIAVIATVVIYACIKLINQFNYPYLEQVISHTFSATGHQISFSPAIKIDWFPRPSIILSHVQISEPNTTQTIIEAPKVEIGMSWSSLWGNVSIEHCTIHHPNIYIHQNKTLNMNHSFDWGKQLNQYINQLTINDATIQFTSELTGSHLIQHVHLNISKSSQSKSVFHAKGITQTTQSDIPWSIQGEGHTLPNHTIQLQNVVFSADAHLPYLGQNHITGTISGIWELSNHHLNINHIQWQQFDTEKKFRVQARGYRWLISPDAIVLPETVANINYQSPNTQSDATININQLKHSLQNGSITSFQINGRIHDTINQTLFNLTGNTHWRSIHDWNIDNLYFNSHQIALNNAFGPRWRSELFGQIHHHLNPNIIDAKLKGQFDNSPISITAQIHHALTTPEIHGSIELDQLQLRSYLDNILHQDNHQAISKIWQLWPTNWQAHWRLKLGKLNTPWGNLQDFSGSLYLNHYKLMVQDIRAKLYNGMTTAQLSADNNTQRSWKLKQQIQNVQLHPLLIDALKLEHIAGLGQAQFELSGTQWLSPQWAHRINGQLILSVRDGYWQGLDVKNIMNMVDTQSVQLPYDRNTHTPFKQFTLAMDFSNGIGNIVQTQLLGDNYQIHGTGSINIPQQTTQATITLHTKINQQQSSTLPINITGDIQQPSFTLDFQKLTHQVHTPEEKEKIIKQTLKQQWQWLNFYPNNTQP